MNLFQHQQAAIDFFIRLYSRMRRNGMNSLGVALLMEMGCGKTVTGISIADFLYHQQDLHKILIAAPLSILSVWEEELAKFAEFPYSVFTLRGTAAQKRQILSQAKRYAEDVRIVIVNYESAWRLEKELLNFDADLIIADEGHKLKENRTAQSKALHHLGDKARFKLLLTGTVITNKEIDVFSQYRFLDSRIFGTSFYAFRNRYFEMTGYGNHIPKFKESMRDEFLQRMHSAAYRVTKQECLDLPEIIEEVRSVSLESKAKKLYRQLEKESFLELDGAEVTAANILTKLLRLSQFTGGHLTDDNGVANTVSTAKLDALSDIIDSTVADGQKLVIMARFVPEINAIQAMVEKRGIGYALVRGGVKERGEEVHRFQKDTDCRVFIGQLQSTALGITLTAAHTTDMIRTEKINADMYSNSV
ncbi:MAG: DEAD/DEAH box helicase, partial [Alistipes sp.]|nr:DEAD/DEAH box helicase [Alistipes sp.]